MKTSFKITNLTCEACVKLSTIALKNLSGVTEVKIDQSTGSVQVESEREIPWTEIQKALNGVGKNASQN